MGADGWDVDCQLPLTAPGTQHTPQPSQSLSSQPCTTGEELLICVWATDRRTSLKARWGCTDGQAVPWERMALPINHQVMVQSLSHREAGTGTHNREELQGKHRWISGIPSLLPFKNSPKTGERSSLQLLRKNSSEENQPKSPPRTSCVAAIVAFPRLSGL